MDASRGCRPGAPRTPLRVTLAAALPTPRRAASPRCGCDEGAHHCQRLRRLPSLPPPPPQVNAGCSAALGRCVPGVAPWGTVGVTLSPWTSP